MAKSELCLRSALSRISTQLSCNRENPLMLARGKTRTMRYFPFIANDHDAGLAARPGLVEECAVLIMNLKYHSLIAFLALVVCFAKETFDSRTWPSLLAYLLLGKIRPTSAG